MSTALNSYFEGYILSFVLVNLMTVRIVSEDPTQGGAKIISTIFGFLLIAQN
jgi:hypothetical protein